MTVLKQSATVTILDALRSHVETQGEETAFTFLKSDDERVSVTYQELDQRARQIAHGLLEVAEPSDRALMMYPAGLEFIEAFLGCLYAGVVAVPAYPPKKNRNTIRTLSNAKDCTPKLLLISSKNERNVVEEFARSLVGVSIVATAELTASCKESLPSVTSDQLAFLQYTSGSTATPKGVMVTHRNIVANEKLIEEHFDFTKESVMVSWLPMFHDMGLIGGVLAPLFVGFPSFLMAPNAFLREPIKWLRAVSEFRGTCTGAPNFAYDLCAKRVTSEQKEKLDLSMLKIAYNGAEPIRAGTLARFTQAFAGCGLKADVFFPCYGLAETTLLVSGGPPMAVTRIVTVDSVALEQHRILESEKGQQIVSCGHIGSDSEVRIVNPRTLIECQLNEIGEIWVNGESVAKGYWNRPKETITSFHAMLKGSEQEWFRTADYGFIREGELFVTGRLKDMIIMHGRNLYPQDIEQVVEQHLDFVNSNDCAAFSIRRDEKDHLVVAVEGTRQIVRWSRAHGDLNGEFTALSHKIDSLRSAVFDEFDVVLADIVFTRPTTFPRTSSGKVQRQLCRQQYLAGSLDCVRIETSLGLLPPESPKHNGSVIRKPTSIVATLAPHASVDAYVSIILSAIESWANDENVSLPALSASTSFYALPMDSLATMDVVRQIEKHLSSELPSGIFHQYRTIGTLADYLSGLTHPDGTGPTNADDTDPCDPVEDSSTDEAAHHAVGGPSQVITLLFSLQLLGCLTAPISLGIVAALFPLMFLSHSVALAAAVLLAPLSFFSSYLLACCCLGRTFSSHIKAGKFVRSTSEKDYRNRRLYGACWCSLYYFGLLYNIVLSLPFLKKLVFRSFGYSGSLDWNIYPDTWIRDLPLLKIGENAYVSNKATLGTNLPLKNGQILVDHVRIGRRSMIGHLAMIGAGTEIGDDAVIGHGSALGIYVSIGNRTSISPRASLDNFVYIGKDCSIGVDCVVHQGAKISEGLVIHPSSVIPCGVTIRTQQQADDIDCRQIRTNP